MRQLFSRKGRSCDIRRQRRQPDDLTVKQRTDLPDPGDSLHQAGFGRSSSTTRLAHARVRAEVAASAKPVLQAPDRAEAKRRLTEKYWRGLRTTNPQERLNDEVRRRERAIRLFPNDDSALRLIGALLAEPNEVWQERKYLDMDDFTEGVAGPPAARATAWLPSPTESDLSSTGPKKNHSRFCTALGCR